MRASGSTFQPAYRRIFFEWLTGSALSKLTELTQLRCTFQLKEVDEIEKTRGRRLETGSGSGVHPGASVGG